MRASFDLGGGSFVQNGEKGHVKTLLKRKYLRTGSDGMKKGERRGLVST